MYKVQKIRAEIEKRYRENKADGYSDVCEELWDILSFIDSLQEEPVSGLDNGDMPIERWKQAVKAASNQRNYRSSKGLTETKDDYFVDGVQWADEHPKEEPVSEDLEEACEQLAENARKHKAETLSPFFSPTDYKQGVMDGAKWQKAKDESTTENLSEYINELSKQFPEVSFAKLSRIAVRVAKWQKKQCNNEANHALVEQIKTQQLCYEKGMADMKQQMMKNIWKPADGDDLPEIDREVIVLRQPYPLEENDYAVSFAHRPNPNGWDGRSITTGNVEHYTPKTYDKGGWNISDVKYWLDVELPKEIEL